jgi:hypothetical protein
MALSSRDHITIHHLRRADVEQTLLGLHRFMKNESWVGQRNRYSIDTIAKLKLESTPGRLQRPRQLSEYIAASCLLHCSDGWSYLGRAISSLLRGDPHRALHLAYYAELKAATSLLATEGIGIFHNRHFAITGSNLASALHTRSGTHEFAWDCLEFWAGQASSGSLFAQLVRPYGISLENWFAPVGGAIVFAPQAQAWFQQWGMDLRILADDRKARNTSSYQPDGVPKTWVIDAHSTVNFVRNLWEALEPSPMCRFEIIDQHILRLSLESAFYGRHGIRPSKAVARFTQFAKQVVGHQGLAPLIEQQWLAFMTRKVTPKTHDIFKFSEQSSQGNNDAHFAVISRAVLLLRSASGSTMRLFQAAGHSVQSFAFWWEAVGHARGLWDGTRDADLQDLWIDIREFLTDVEAFQDRHMPQDQTLYRLCSEMGHAVVGLSSCERVGLWGMAP